jgi:hypothetical protein
MAHNDELLAKARFYAGQIIDGDIDPLVGANQIWKECFWQCAPHEPSLDPFVYWADEAGDSTDFDRQIYCRRAIVVAARQFLDPSLPSPSEFSADQPGVLEAIRRAEQVIDFSPAPEGQDDARWQAIIAVAEFIEVSPEPIWQFIRRWGPSRDEDLQDAVATCLLEHLLEHHFDAYFERVAALARAERSFASVFLRCWALGQSELVLNAVRFNALRRELSG